MPGPVNSLLRSFIATSLPPSASHGRHVPRIGAAKHRRSASGVRAGWNNAGVHAGARNNVTFAGLKTGPTIVLAHGFGCDQNLWRLVVARLRDDFRLVLFDHVGSG